MRWRGWPNSVATSRSWSPRLSPWLHVTWTGEGAAAHAEAQRHWAAGEAMMRQALAQLTAAGQSAHANYTGAMATNLGMWS